MFAYSLYPFKNSQLFDYEIQYKTWNIITDTTLAAPANSIDIQNIPAGYSVIWGLYLCKSSAAGNDNLQIILNNDTTVGKYREGAMRNLADTQSNFTDTNRANDYIGEMDETYWGGGYFFIFNSTTGPKAIWSANAAKIETHFAGCEYNSATEVNRITIKCESASNFVTASRFILMGWK